MVSRRRFAWNGNMDGCRLGFWDGVFRLNRKGKVVEFVASVCYLYISKTCDLCAISLKELTAW